MSFIGSSSADSVGSLALSPRGSRRAGNSKEFNRRRWIPWASGIGILLNRLSESMPTSANSESYYEHHHNLQQILPLLRQESFFYQNVDDRTEGQQSLLNCWSGILDTFPILRKPEQKDFHTALWLILARVEFTPENLGVRSFSQKNTIKWAVGGAHLPICARFRELLYRTLEYASGILTPESNSKTKQLPIASILNFAADTLAICYFILDFLQNVMSWMLREHAHQQQSVWKKDQLQVDKNDQDESSEAGDTRSRRLARRGTKRNFNEDSLILQSDDLSDVLAEISTLIDQEGKAIIERSGKAKREKKRSKLAVLSSACKGGSASTPNSPVHTRKAPESPSLSTNVPKIKVKEAPKCHEKRSGAHTSRIRPKLSLPSISTPRLDKTQNFGERLKMLLAVDKLNDTTAITNTRAQISSSPTWLLRLVEARNGEYYYRFLSSLVTRIMHIGTTVLNNSTTDQQSQPNGFVVNVNPLENQPSISLLQEMDTIDIGWCNIQGYYDMLLPLLVTMYQKAPSHYPPNLLQCTKVLLVNGYLLNTFIKFSFKNTNVYNHRLTIGTLDALGVWISQFEQFPPCFDSSFFFEGLTILLDSEHYAIITETLLFLWDHITPFKGEFRVQILNLMLDKFFLKLFLHWEWGIRNIFQNFLVYKLQTLENSETRADVTTQKRVFALVDSIKKQVEGPEDHSTFDPYLQPYAESALETWSVIQKEFIHWASTEEPRIPVDLREKYLKDRAALEEGRGDVIPKFVDLRDKESLKKMVGRIQHNQAVKLRTAKRVLRKKR